MDIDYFDDGSVFVDRDVRGIPCKCNGYASSVDCTAAECLKYGCGWDAPGRECCARAFVCRACGSRIVGRAHAPEME